MSSEDNNSTANNNRHPIPIDTDNNPVNFHDNPAHIEGALEEFRLWCDVANGSTIGLDKYQAAVAVQPLSGGLP